MITQKHPFRKKKTKKQKRSCLASESPHTQPSSPFRGDHQSQHTWYALAVPPPSRLPSDSMQRIIQRRSLINSAPSRRNPNYLCLQQMGRSRGQHSNTARRLLLYSILCADRGPYTPKPRTILTALSTYLPVDISELGIVSKGTFIVIAFLFGVDIDTWYTICILRSSKDGSKSCSVPLFLPEPLRTGCIINTNDTAGGG